MKKIFLTLMVMVAAVAANAQVWVGGSLGFGQIVMLSILKPKGV